MSKTIVNLFLLFIALIITQVLIFNHVCIFNIATPIVFIYFILRLPITLSLNLVLTLSFFLGLSIDIFSDTQGMNALACTILGALRRPVFLLYFPREDDMSNSTPSIRSLGIGIYLKYLFTLTFFYCILIFFIQAFTFFNLSLTIFRIIGSSVLSFFIMFGFECLNSTNREKRL